LANYFFKKWGKSNQKVMEKLDKKGKEGI